MLATAAAAAVVAGGLASMGGSSFLQSFRSGSGPTTVGPRDTLTKTFTEILSNIRPDKRARSGLQSESIEVPELKKPLSPLIPPSQRPTVVGKVVQVATEPIPLPAVQGFQAEKATAAVPVGAIVALFIIRHGESEQNEAQHTFGKKIWWQLNKWGWVGGDEYANLKDAVLNKHGVQQVFNIANALVEMVTTAMKDGRLRDDWNWKQLELKVQYALILVTAILNGKAHIVTSPLRRTIATLLGTLSRMQDIATALGIQFPDSFKIVLDAFLTEASWNNDCDANLNALTKPTMQLLTESIPGVKPYEDFTSEPPSPKTVKFGDGENDPPISIVTMLTKIFSHVEWDASIYYPLAFVHRGHAGKGDLRLNDQPAQDKMKVKLHALGTVTDAFQALQPPAPKVN